MTWRYREIAHDAVYRACEQAVKECLFHGVTATELRQLMGSAWTEVLQEQARWGAQEFDKCQTP